MKRLISALLLVVLGMNCADSSASQKHFSIISTEQLDGMPTSIIILRYNATGECFAYFYNVGVLKIECPR